MSAKEQEFTYYQSEESTEDTWLPDFYLKPHHAVFSERIRSAVTQTKRPKAPLLLFYLLQRINLYGATRDEYGSSMKEIRESLEREANILDIVESLPDETNISLDLRPDAFCQSCVVGRHCSATNFKAGPFPNKDTAESEQKQISNIHLSLLENGFEEGKDFVFRPTNHTLYDFGGGNFKNTPNPEPLSVSFNSMVVKMGALRKVVQTMPKA